MKRFFFAIPIMVIVISGCGETQPNHPSAASKTPVSIGNEVVQKTKPFSAKPVLPKSGGKRTSAEWDVLKLPRKLGAINPASSDARWQAMNFGQDKPVFAENDESKLYMGTDAGVWYRRGQRWTYMPGTEKFAPIVAITVTPAGAPIVATHTRIFAYESKHWVRISNKQEGGIHFLRWTKDGQLAAGVTDYPKSKGSSIGTGGPAPMPIRGVMLFDGEKWSKMKGLNDTRNLIDYSRQESSLNVPDIGIRGIGLSPKGTPIIETSTDGRDREIWQGSHGTWSELNMTGFPASNPGLGSYVETRDVAWWNGKLVVSSPIGGVMEWNGSTWVTLGNNRGMTSQYHRMGSVMTTTSNTLFAEVKETVPAPPKTPNRLVNTLWEFQQNRWQQLKFPKSTSGYVFGDPVISRKGNVAVSETGPWSRNHIWLYRSQHWQEIGRGTGIFENAHVERMKFAPNGRLTVELVGGTTASSVNVYEWTGRTWIPMFKSNDVVSTHQTYWFDYVWAPDGSIIVGLMNGKGYSIWRYRDGKWVDLGLYGQRPESLYVTKQGTLFVITNKYVCWHYLLHI